MQVKLKEYLIYIGANTGFDPAQYFDSADQEGTLQIESNVDVYKRQVLSLLLLLQMVLWLRQESISCFPVR